MVGLGVDLKITVDLAVTGETLRKKQDRKYSRNENQYPERPL
jgi:hypothetical protein